MEAPDRNSSLPTTSSTDGYENVMRLGSQTSTTAKDEYRANVLKEFTTLLGTKPSSSNDRDSGASALVKLLSNSLDDDVVVLTLPSLDLRLSEGDTSLLPDVGETTKSSEGLEMLPEKSARPSMTASVLTLATEGKANIEHKAAQNIGKPTSWTRSSLRYASAAVSTNILESFTQLVNSRIRSWTLLLLRHSLSTGDNESRSRLLSMLSAKVKAISSETNFMTLQLPPSAAGKPKEADVILPLLFEAHLTITIQDKSEKVLIRAPGTVSALFNGDDVSDGLKKVMLRLDSGVVMSSLIDHARMAVLKAVASVTKSPEFNRSSPQPTAPKSQDQDQQNYNDVQSPVSSSNLSTLRSALNLSPHDAEQSLPLQKARSSALKLNSVLHGKSVLGRSNTSAGMRKVRSVKWEEPMNCPKLGPSLAPNPKKLRLVDTSCKLKSFKSFGRPHGGDTGSGPGNATFGAFGGSGSAGVWGRDGRLAYHPKPMTQSITESDQMGMTGLAERNATFSLPKENTSTSSPSPFSHLLLRSQFPGSNGIPATTGSTLPRTATALENSLLRKWS